MIEWQPMETFPKDGTRCDILFAETNTIAENVFWGQHPIKGDWGYRGDHNMLSQYCIDRGLKGWRKREVNA